VRTVNGTGLSAYAHEAQFSGGALSWYEDRAKSRDEAIIKTARQPFMADGGLTTLSGNLGRCIAKTSAVKKELQSIEAPCRVFDSQEAVDAAFKKGELHRDVVCVVRFQGPRANGMPELHKLMSPLGVLQDLGFKVALLTDGRMSGASGKVLSAIHVTPEALGGGVLSKLRDGDIVRIDVASEVIEVKLDAAELAARPVAEPPRVSQWGTGRELFAPFRQVVSPADHGATIFAFDGVW